MDETAKNGNVADWGSVLSVEHVAFLDGLGIEWQKDEPDSEVLARWLAVRGRAIDEMDLRDIALLLFLPIDGAANQGQVINSYIPDNDNITTISDLFIRLVMTSVCADKLDVTAYPWEKGRMSLWASDWSYKGARDLVDKGDKLAAVHVDGVASWGYCRFRLDGFSGASNSDWYEGLLSFRVVAEVWRDYLIDEIEAQKLLAQQACIDELFILFDATYFELRKISGSETSRIDELLGMRNELKQLFPISCSALKEQDPKINDLFNKMFDSDEQNLIAGLVGRVEAWRLSQANEGILCKLPDNLVTDDWRTTDGGITDNMCINNFAVMVQPYVFHRPSTSQGQRRKNSESVALEIVEVMQVKGLRSDVGEYPSKVMLRSQQVKISVSIADIEQWLARGYLDDFYKPYVNLWRLYCQDWRKSALSVPLDWSYLDKPRDGVELRGDATNLREEVYCLADDFIQQGLGVREAMLSAMSAFKEKYQGVDGVHAIVNSEYVDRDWQPLPQPKFSNNDRVGLGESLPVEQDKQDDFGYWLLEVANHSNRVNYSRVGVVLEYASAKYMQCNQGKMPTTANQLKPYYSMVAGELLAREELRVKAVNKNNVVFLLNEESIASGGVSNAFRRFLKLKS